ncbi:HAD family hydrolase [Agarivorans sp. MS3-6]|uniref:HAD family hydrolase n=1 Tax=Agarivorans sp. TSD2052 TaxID=2937286 RepID=UPI00200D71B0|nr:HAD family phosphatase [Agarivorans sp. TSD2052]UPW17853.1 HAD family phosphatase [Agarivorans sp. TSD2052]
MTYHAAVFDMDGLLLDSERVSYDTFAETCAELGIEFKEQVYLGIIGTNAGQIKRILCAGYGDDFPYDEVRACWLEKYHAITMHQALPIKDGVVELLAWLKSQSIPLAVATSSGRPAAEAKLQHAGLSQYFDSVSTGCEVSHSKPHPEIFLMAASALDTQPQHCLAFEDSDNGVRAAVAAGMRVYQIPDLIPPSPQLKQLGHQIRHSLADVLSELS